MRKRLSVEVEAPSRVERDEQRQREADGARRCPRERKPIREA
jgi:hypothetical protein